MAQQKNHVLEYITSLSLSSKRGKKAKCYWNDFVKENLANPQKSFYNRNNYQVIDEEKQLEVKSSAGWYVFGERNDDHPKRRALNRHAVTIDIDKNGDEDVIEKISSLFSKYHYAIHDTVSSTKDFPRYRFILPLAEPIDLDQYRALATLICQQVGLDRCDVKSSRSAHQLMFFPILFKKDDVYECITNDGQFLNGSFYLDNVWLSVFEGDWRDYSSWPDIKEEGRRRRHRNVNDLLQANPRDKPGLVGDFCRAYSISEAVAKFLGPVWTDEGDNRFTYARGSSKRGGIAYPFEGEGVEGPEDKVFLYSHHESDPYNDQLLNAWDLVRLHRFGNEDLNSKAQKDDKLPSWAMMSDLVRKDKRVIVSRAERDTAEFEAIAETAKKEAREDSESGEGAEGGKGDGAIKRIPLKRNDSGKIYLSSDNLIMALQRANIPVGKNILMDRLVFTGDDERLNVKLKKSERFMGKLLRDRDLTIIAAYFERHMDLNRYPITRNMMYEALDGYAPKFNPITRYLDALPQWDGEARVPVFWVKTAGVVDDDYTREVTTCFLCNAVSIAYKPGNTATQVPILVGPEGAGKSSMVQKLLPQSSLFTSGLSLKSEKEFIETSSGFWVAELAEVDTLYKSESATIKKLITADKMTARLSYDRIPTTVKKSLVIYGSTNETGFLRRDMGSRRWLPLENKDTKKNKKHKKIAQKNFKWINKNRDQIWAEALHLAKKNKFKPMSCNMNIDENIQSHKRHELGDEEYDNAVFYLNDNLCYGKRVCVKEIRESFQMKNVFEVNRAIANALKDEGWVGGVKTRSSDYNSKPFDTMTLSLNFSKRSFYKQRGFYHPDHLPN